MGQPDGSNVNYAALRADAAAWEEQRADLRSVSEKIRSTDLTGVEMGLLLPIHGPYHDLVDKLARVIGQGADAAEHISRSLIETLDAYQGVDHGSGQDIGGTAPRQIDIPHF